MNSDVGDTDEDSFIDNDSEVPAQDTNSNEDDDIYESDSDSDEGAYIGYFLFLSRAGCSKTG